MCVQQELSCLLAVLKFIFQLQYCNCKNKMSKCLCSRSLNVCQLFSNSSYNYCLQEQNVLMCVKHSFSCLLAVPKFIFELYSIVSVRTKCLNVCVVGVQLSASLTGMTNYSRFCHCYSPEAPPPHPTPLLLLLPCQTCQMFQIFYSGSFSLLCSTDNLFIICLHTSTIKNAPNMTWLKCYEGHSMCHRRPFVYYY